MNHSATVKSESPVACWIILKEDGSIMSCHNTCMAGIKFIVQQSRPRESFEHI